MSVSLRNSLLGFIDARIASLLAKPALWGSNESVELQILQLLETRAIVLRPEERTRMFGLLRSGYDEFVRTKLPNAGPLTIAGYLEQVQRADSFSDLLSEFTSHWKPARNEIDANKTNDLVITIRLREDVSAPPLSAISGVYEAFRRVIRGIARPNLKGRTPKEIEAATEFTASDIQISPTNGIPGRVLLPLQLPVPNQKSFLPDAAELVRTAGKQLAAVAEWAGSGDSVDVLSKMIPDEKKLQRLSFQALRLIPRNADAYDSIELGGTQIDRMVPVVFNPSLSASLLNALREGQQAEHIEVSGTARMTDLDLGSLAVKPSGSKRQVWWVGSGIQLPRDLLDSEVRVVGTRYRGSAGGSILIADTVDVIRRAVDEED